MGIDDIFPQDFSEPQKSKGTGAVMSTALNVNYTLPDSSFTDISGYLKKYKL